MIVRALFAGPGARRALVAGSTGTVEMVFPRAAYLTLDEDWLLLAEPSAPFGPLSLSMSGFGELRLEPGLAVRVEGARVRFGEHAVSLERVRLRGCPVPWVSGNASAVVAAADAAGAEIAAAPGPMADGIAALARGRLSAAVEQLAGLGRGLTPAGDDVLAGYAAARFVLDAGGGPISARAAGRSSPLGLAYLRCAERGELPDAGARLLAAICAGSVEEVRPACRRLRGWGASSGTALAWGIAAATGQARSAENGRRGAHVLAQAARNGTVSRAHPAGRAERHGLPRAPGRQRGMARSRPPAGQAARPPRAAGGPWNVHVG